MAKQSPLQFKNLEDLEKSGIKLTHENKQKFEEFFADNMEDLTQTTFPQLSKFMDKEKVREEDKASDQISNTQATRNGPQLLLDGTMIDTLDQIDDRLKATNVTLVSVLEQETLQNQLLNRLVANAGNSGGGNGNGEGSGGSLLNSILGGASIGNFIKTFGTRLIGGAIGAALSPEVAIAAGGAALAGGAAYATFLLPHNGTPID